jgi:DNA repair protein RadC
VGKRRNEMAAKGTRIRCPEDIYDVVRPWARRREENFLAITLNGAHEVIKVHHITKGLVNRTIVHPRECFYPAIKDYASSVAFVHNHPSGNVEPSSEDFAITERLCHAACILGFNLVDHLVIARNGNFFSFRRENGIHDKFTNAEDREFVGYLAAEGK